MASTNAPDFTKGFPADDLQNGGMIQCRVGDEDVILARHADEFFAVGAGCTHYHGPLADGLIVGDELRCPLHHACFSLRTGMASSAPAFEAIPRWRVDRVGNRVFVRERLPALAQYPETKTKRPPNSPPSVVILGGGAAGLAAAEVDGARISPPGCCRRPIGILRRPSGALSLKERKSKCHTVPGPDSGCRSRWFHDPLSIGR